MPLGEIVTPVGGGLPGRRKKRRRNEVPLRYGGKREVIDDSEQIFMRNTDHLR